YKLVTGVQTCALPISDRLREMGPLTRAERLVLAIFSVVLVLWLASEWIGLSATAIAWLGVAMLLLTRVLEWKDILDEKGAWDARSEERRVGKECRSKR